MTAREHDKWADSAGAYVLQALDDHERAGFERHLGGCHVCRDEVERLQVAADALPASPEQLSPPPELKDRIMAVVRSEAELLQAAGGDVVERAERPRERRRRWTLRPAMGLAATAAVLVAGVVAGLSLRDGDGGGPSDVRTVVAQVDLPGPASARLEVGDDNRAKLVTANVPPPESGRVYQVWVLRDGLEAPEATDALFTVGRDGSASVDVPVALEGVDKVMVTSEPDGGSDAPTRQPFIVASPA